MRRILYVEDNPQNMLLMGRILEAEGHQLLRATDGASGLEQAIRHQPDLILTDLRLPGPVSGFELARRIRRQPAISRTPIVALTAYGSPLADEKALLAGCDEVLHKPADIQQIRAVVHRHLQMSMPPLVTPAVLEAFVTAY